MQRSNVIGKCIGEGILLASPVLIDVFGHSLSKNLLEIITYEMTNCNEKIYR